MADEDIELADLHRGLGAAGVGLQQVQHDEQRVAVLLDLGTLVAVPLVVDG